jgi:hypothetical protein
MELQTFHYWEIVLDVAQICLCGCIILFLILNRIKFKKLVLSAPSTQGSRPINADFVIETVRQQIELAFNHIVETIDTERRTLDEVFQQPEQRMATGLLAPVSVTYQAQHSVEKASAGEPARAVYTEIENLAGQGLSQTDISERLNVSQGEVDLVLKLKQLRSGAVKSQARRSA